MRSNLQLQLTGIQSEYENALLRAEEEADAASQFRNQLSRLTSEWQTLKTKYDKEVLHKAEEFEETRSVEMVDLLTNANCHVSYLIHYYSSYINQKSLRNTNRYVFGLQEKVNNPHNGSRRDRRT